jgi:hypothetical protein
MSVVIDNIRPQDDDKNLHRQHEARAQCSRGQAEPCLPAVRRDAAVPGVPPAVPVLAGKKVLRTHNQQCVVMLRQNLIFHHLRIPLFTLDLIWPMKEYRLSDTVLKQR